MPKCCCSILGLSRPSDLLPRYLGARSCDPFAWRSSKKVNGSFFHSRNTDIRAMPDDFANSDASNSFSAFNETFFDWLDALESSGLPLDDYACVVCPEMSGNLLRGDTWGGVSGNVRKCPEIPKIPLSLQNS